MKPFVRSERVRLKNCVLRRKVAAQLHWMLGKCNIYAKCFHLCDPRTGAGGQQEELWQCDEHLHSCRVKVQFCYQHIVIHCAHRTFKCS